MSAASIAENSKQDRDCWSQSQPTEKGEWGERAKAWTFGLCESIFSLCKKSSEGYFNLSFMYIVLMVWGLHASQN